MAAAVSLLDIITEVLSLLQVYAPGEPIAAADSASLLFTANGIVDGWGAEPLTIYQSTILNFNTAPGKQSYTLGVDPSNDWITSFLPAKIPRFGTIINGIEVPLDDPLDDSGWAAIGLKNLSSPIATKVWPEYGAPFHTLWFWPLPAVISPMVLYADQQVPRFTALANSVVLPPGYQEAFTYELALKSAAKFGAGAVVPDWLPAAWAAAKTRIKEFNFPALDARCDPALTAGGRTGGGSINFYLGK